MLAPSADELFLFVDGMAFYWEAAWESLSSINRVEGKEGLDVGFVGEFIAEGKGDSFFAQAGSSAFLGHIFEELGEVVVGDFGANFWEKGFEELIVGAEGNPHFADNTDNVGANHKAVGIALDEFYPSVEVVQYIIGKDNPRKVDIELVAIAGEHLVDPEMQVFHNDAPADAGMSPDEGGRLSAITAAGS